MDFMTLAAIVCREFTSQSRNDSSQIVSVKNEKNRDVVTSLDLHLDSVVRQFVFNSDPTTVLLSEEASHNNPRDYWDATSLIVLDPLDGSNNYALSLPGYGLMVTHLIDTVLVNSLVVLPERNLYLLWNGDQLITSQPVVFGTSVRSSTTYYAYPPTVHESLASARNKIMELADDYSAGIYRSGAACIGLFQLLTGRHAAFIGHEVRVWDVLAYLPLIAYLGIPVRYRIEGFTATLIASQDHEFLTEIEKVMADAPNPAFNDFQNGRPLVIGEK